MTAALLIAYIVVFLARRSLEWVNARHLQRHGHQIPSGFEDRVDHDTLERAAAYTLDQIRLGRIESLLGAALLLMFLFGGWLGAYDRWIASLTGSFVWGGMLFFLGLHYAQTLLGIPFDLYKTFRLEARYEFNTTTRKLWIADLLKSEAVATVLIAALAGGALGLMRWSPNRWWLWVWAFYTVFTVFLMYVAPFVIEPLFFKFEPIKEEGLESEIRTLMGRVGLAVSRVFQVDASKRSRHSNAYFTGIGRVKRIVLFDTLLGQMSRDEILAVLAHEAGHWKMKHLLKRLAVTEVMALAGLYLAFRLLAWGGLPELVGLAGASVPAALVILSFVGGVLFFPLSPVPSALSRRHERAADRFACSLIEDPGALASALVTLFKDNLANLHPHPLYAWFYYSHPPLAERVTGLRARSSEPAPAAGSGLDTS
jgi:STE24 endopeptidase